MNTGKVLSEEYPHLNQHQSIGCGEDPNTQGMGLSYLQSLPPRRLQAGAFWIHSDGVQLLLEEQQAAVHDPHNQMWRLGQFPHSGNVRWFDGLCTIEGKEFNKANYKIPKKICYKC